jgi:hypothetical protein
MRAPDGRAVNRERDKEGRQVAPDRLGRRVHDRLRRPVDTSRAGRPSLALSPGDDQAEALEGRSDAHARDPRPTPG